MAAALSHRSSAPKKKLNFFKRTQLQAEQGSPRLGHSGDTSNIRVIDFRVKYIKQLSEQSRSITTEYPVELPLQDYLVSKYVLHNDKELQKVNCELKNVQTSTGTIVTTSKDAEHTIVISKPLELSDIKGFYRVVQSCILKAQPHVSYRVIQTADGESLLDRLLRTQLGKRQLIYGEIADNNHSVLLVFDRHQEQCVERIIESVVNQLNVNHDAAASVRKVEIEEQWADIADRLGLEEGIKCTFPDIDIQINVSESGALVLRLEGEKTDLINAERFIEKFKHDVVFEKSKLHILETKIFLEENLIIRVNDYLKNLNLVCNLEVDLTRGNFVVAAQNAVTARKALDHVTKLIIERKIQVPANCQLHLTVESDNWNRIRHDMMKKHPFEVFISLKDNVIFVTGINEKVNNVVKQLTAINEEAGAHSIGSVDKADDEDMTDTTQYTIDNDEVYIYLTEVMRQSLLQQAKKIGVTLKMFKHETHQEFLIHGTLKNNRNMAAKLDKIVELVQTDNQEFDDSGYFNTTSGKDFIDKVEEKCHVLIDIAHNQSSIKVIKDNELSGTVVGVPLRPGNSPLAWEFRDRYRLQLTKAKLEDTGAAVVVQYRSSSAKKVDLQWKVKANFAIVSLPVPPWKDQNDSHRALKDVLSRLFIDALTRDCRSVAMPLEDVGSWSVTSFTSSAISAFVNVCCHVNRVSGAANDGKLTLILCSTNSDVVETCRNVCDVELKGTAEQVAMVADRKTISNVDRPLNKIGVSVVKGALNATKVDVLVNTTSPNLDLNFGAVSSSLLRSAGQQLQRELDKHYPEGLHRGDLAITKGYNLDCRHVLHGVLYPYKGQCKDEERFYRESVHNFMTLCLSKAAKQKCRSIAFPAVGAGKLGYPVDIVAEEMFNAVNDFQDQHEQTTLEQVVFVVYFTDDDAFEEFSRLKDELERRSQKDQSADHVTEKRQSTCTVVRLVGFADNIEKAAQHIEDRLVYLQNVQSTPSNSMGQGHIRSPSTTSDDITNDDEDVIFGADKRQAMHNYSNARTHHEKSTTKDTAASTTNQSKSHQALTSRGNGMTQSEYRISAIDWALVNHFHAGLVLKYEDSGVTFHYKNDRLLIEADVSTMEIFDVEFRSVVSKLANLLKDELGIAKMDMKMVKQSVDEVAETDDVFCIHDAANMQVLLYSDCWNSIQTAKHALKVKLGIVKTSERGQRNFQMDSSDDDEYGFKRSDGANYSSVIHKTSYGEADVKTSTGAIPKKSQPSSAARKPMEIFITNEHVKVKVYEADIVNVNVDCIVNAANKKLKHGGGIAKVIAKASGSELVKDGDKFIKTHGKLRTGDVHVTDPGKLPYRCVIHAVGPCWMDYRPHNKDLVDRCETDLMAAILNSLNEAERLHMTSIAIPAVSSAIFGVPWQICTVQYARAILDYSRHRLPSSLLAEIHFIDINPHMVERIMKTFRVMIPGGKLPDFYKDRSFLKQISGRSVIGGEYGDSRDRNNDSVKSDQKPPAATSHPTTYPPSSASGPGEVFPQYSQTLLHGKTDNIFTCKLSDKQILYVYNDDILKLKDIDVIVCSDDTTGSGKGIVAKKLAEKGGKKFEKAKNNAYKRSPQVGDVVLCEGMDTGFKWVIHAILHTKKDIAGEEDKRSKRQEVFEKIFAKIKGLGVKVKSMAIPLLGTGTGKGRPEYSAEHLWESYMKFSQNNTDVRLAVHLVNIEVDKTQIAVRTIKSLIDNTRPVIKQTGRSRASTAGWTTTTKTTTTTTQNTQMPRSSMMLNSSDQSQRSKSSAAHAAGIHGDSSRSSRNSNVAEVYKLSASQQISGQEKDIIDENMFQKLQITTSQEHSTPSNHKMEADDKTVDKEDDDCVICMDTMIDAKKLKCGHKFCAECIDQQFAIKKVCPTCGLVCGILTGDQPDGEMAVTVSQLHHCAGYETVGQIQIVYSFPNGYQGQRHPDPGKSYRGISRTAYLPDNTNGRLIGQMLKVAFDRRLVFTIGNSRTTGQQGVITWNDVHHKTDPTPHAMFGYPDPTYLDRVKDELAAKGVTEKDVKSKEKCTVY